MKINVDANVGELIESWISGNLTTVLDALENDHPGLVAVFLIQGLQDKTLSVSDCNHIANRLIDRRVARVNAPERERPDLDNGDSPEAFVADLRLTADYCDASALELQSAWQDGNAGKVWQFFASAIRRTIKSCERHI